VQILEPMEETRTQLIMVTEAIFASSLDLLNKFEGLPGQRQAVRLSELDCKAGLLQVHLP
jgi:SCY1-like protein 2